MSSAKKLEIPLPPKTLPLFHDAMCTALCIAIAEVGSEVVHNISIEYDHSKALSKVAIECDADLFNKKFDELFGTPKLKPSVYVTINNWSYFVNKDLTGLEMGGERFPSRVMRIEKNRDEVIKDMAKAIRKQCYLFAKGYKYISIREEATRLKPIRGYLKLGFDHSILTLLHKILVSSSRTVNIMGDPYTLILLISDPPNTVDEAFAVSRSFYKVNYEKGVNITLNEDIIRHIIPRGSLSLLLNVPDIIYHNLTLNLVGNYIQGTIDISNLPPVSIYVFSGRLFDKSKSIITHFVCNNKYIQELYSTLTNIHGFEKTSRLIYHLNRAIQYLGDISQKAQVSKEFAIIETIIPHIRIFMNNLVSGAPYIEPLYMVIRILKELERIDDRFRLMAEELLEAIL